MKHTRTISLIALIVILVISLVACSAAGATSTAAATTAGAAATTAAATKATAAVKVVTLRLGHTQPAAHLVNETALAFAKLVNEKTNGEVKIDVYPAETLGTNKELSDACSNGDVDFYISATGQYTQRYAPFSIVDAFYMFRNSDHLFKFYESDVYKELVAGLKKTCNVDILAPIYYGTRQMTTSNRPLKTPDDFKGIKLRAANEPLPIAAIEALGGIPTPIAYGETYLALQQGVADGQENPPMSISTMKFYEVQKYLNMTDHQFQMLSIFMSEINKSKVNAQQLAIITAAAKEVAVTHNKKSIDLEKDYVKQLGEKLQVITPDKAAFAAKVSAMYPKFTKTWGEGMVDRIQAIK